MCAFLGREGDSLEKLVGGKLSPWIDIHFDVGDMTVPDPVPIFFHDVPEALAMKAVAELRPQSYIALTTPSASSSWADDVWNGKRAYVVCMQDKCIPIIGQQSTIERSGVEWEVRELDSSHSPFLSMPDRVRDVVVELVEKFVALHS